MEPFTIALVCVGLLGSAIIGSVFLRQLTASHNMIMNKKAHKRAFVREMAELEKTHMQMVDYKPFASHYKLPLENKDTISYLDSQINAQLQKKRQYIERYVLLVTKEAMHIIEGEISLESKQACDLIKQELDLKIVDCQQEIKQLQARRLKLWKSNQQLHVYLKEQEEARNQVLDGIYKRYAAILDKLFLRHIMSGEPLWYDEEVAYLMQYFKPSLHLNAKKLEQEKRFRKEILNLEKNLLIDDTVDTMRILQEAALPA
jgi:hypothetical protein